MSDRKSNTASLLPLFDYDRIVVAFSGGKDSLACLLHLLSLGLRQSLELWHHDVDGKDRQFMDWPCTLPYCQGVADALVVPLLQQWRHGGFRREMLRENAQAAPISFEDLDGTVRTLESSRSKFSTRRKFPQVSADLSTRWCSSSLKIDVATKAINNLPRFKGAKVLLVTGERAEESSARAKYPQVENHKSNTKSRIVHQWRPVQDWTEEQVWAIIQEYGVVAHPAYYLGYGRVSCAHCIFGNNDQWATGRQLLPTSFDEIAGHEQDFGVTIHRQLPVVERADKGTPYQYSQQDAQRAVSYDPWSTPLLLPPSQWTLPAGAYKRCGGPS